MPDKKPMDLLKLAKEKSNAPGKGSGHLSDEEAADLSIAYANNEIDMNGLKAAFAQCGMSEKSLPIVVLGARIFTLIKRGILKLERV